LDSAAERATCDEAGEFEEFSLAGEEETIAGIPNE
jgi:hypothetical protein